MNKKYIINLQFKICQPYKILNKYNYNSLILDPIEYQIVLFYSQEPREFKPQSFLEDEPKLSKVCIAFYKLLCMNILVEVEDGYEFEIIY